jgi:hypothetical protein
MKTFVKTSIVAAFALAMVTLGTSNARAGGFYVAAPLPVAVRPAPVYVAPAPFYGPRVVVGAPYYYGYPYARFGWGWGWGGPHHFYYHHR